MNVSMARNAFEHWSYVAPLFKMPHDETSYQEMVDVLDMVLDEGGTDEDHPLASLANVLGDFIEEYESQTLKSESGTGVDALKFLMDAHNIKQGELPEVGSQGVVSEILRGKRQLNIRQIRDLAKRFGVSEQTFI